MPALESASLSLLVTGGEPGGSFQAGNQKVETLDGLRLLGLNFSPNSSSVNHQQGTISRSMETTWGSLRDGGKGGVEISKQMQSSTEFTSYHKSTIALYTHNMSQVQKIQQTSPLVESTLPFTSYSHLYPFQAKSPHISLISMSSNPILTNAILEVLIQNSDHSLPASSSNVEGKLRNMPLPPFLPPKRRPGPYPCNLTLKISSRRPHCLARD